MKSITYFLFATTLLTISAFGNEQCDVLGLPSELKENTVTGIMLPKDLSGAYLSLNGYNLDCDALDATENKYCVFEYDVNSDRTVYEFGNGYVVKVERNERGQLTGDGEFKSRKYTHTNKFVSLHCSVPRAQQK